MAKNSLKFCAWNIHGYNSRQIGNKFEDNEFLDCFKNADFIGLTETHIHNEVLDKMNIAGFSRLVVKNQSKNVKSNTASKGIAVFVKEEIKDIFHPVPMDNEDVIWVRINKEDTGRKRDIYIATCYLNPSQAKGTDRKISNLTEDIISLQKKGDVMIQGDLNAKTGKLEDIITPDKSDELFDLCIDQPPQKRNSQDDTVNPRGNELLDLCKSLDLNIVNGRKTGDLFGNYTCFQWNGNSVVDYLVTSSCALENVMKFQVGDFLPWLSDHCPIYFTLELHSSLFNNPVTEAPRKTAPKQYVWPAEEKQKYMNSLQSQYFQTKLDRFSEVDLSDPNLAVSYITDVLIDAAEKTKLKSVKRNIDKDPPWFNDSCHDIKDNIKRLGKKVKKEPKNDHIRRELFSEKKKLKNQVKKNKTEFKKQLMEEMKQSNNDSKKFWKLLDKFEKRNDDTMFKTGIKDQRWLSHFKSVFQSTDGDKSLPKNTAEKGELDFEISLSELKIGAYVLRLGKSPGFDSISNEMLLCLLDSRPEILKTLFNSILRNPRAIDKWSISMINPIHKSGSKMDPDNYRGISLLSCFSKYFSAILNLRLTQFAIDKKIFSSSQLGFLAGCRTSDAHFILQNLIDLYCKKKNQHIFGCFVDFKKAFDTIPRHKLFQKLLDNNINGKFYDILVNMYSNDIACIKISDTISPSFIANQGVKQGCILSPTLFNIFLSDIQSIFDTAECDPVQLNGDTLMGCIIWADDILLLSKSETGLGSMLSALNIYSKQNGMTVNTKKTKTIVFNKTGRFMRRSFYLGKEKLESTREYKYLGFIVTPSGEITTGLKDLKDRALRAFAKLKHKLGDCFRKYPLLSLKLFRSLVQPILLYASDFWGILKMPDNNPVENLFSSFCKQLLGVQKQATNIGVLLELGQVPLSTIALRNAIKNWVRIANNVNCNQYTLKSYEFSISKKLTWVSNIEHKLSEIGFRGLFLCKDETTHLKAFERIVVIFHQEALSSIQSNDRKLRTYALLKETAGFENYLTEIKSIKKRTALTKLRLSNHMLMIEKGRHEGKDRSKRFCPFCPDDIENEMHFLLKCKAYKCIRQEFLDSAEKYVPPILERSDTQNFISLINKAPGPTSNFVYKASEMREYLLRKHKVLG